MTPAQTTISIQDTSIPEPTAEVPFATTTITQSTVSIWHSLGEGQTSALVDIITTFTNLHPNVYFDVLFIPEEELLPRFVIETLSGGGPTLLLGPQEWGISLYDEGLITSLEGAIDSKLLETINKPVLGSVIFDEMLLGLPFTIQGVVLYRNKEIMTITPGTFEDLIALSQAATQGEILGAVLERGFLYSGGHLEGLGGQLMDANGMPAFNNAKGMEWLQLLRDFELAGPPEYLTDQYIEKFIAGEIGWIIDGTWNMNGYSEALGEENLAIDPWPTYLDHRLSGFVMAENLYLSSLAKSQHKEATLEFMRYLLSPQAQVAFAEKNSIPAILETPGFDSIGWPLIHQAMIALAGGANYPSFPVMDIYNLQLDIAIQAYLEGGTPPEVALQNAHNAILSQISIQNPVSLPTPSPSP